MLTVLALVAEALWSTVVELMDLAIREEVRGWRRK